MSFLFNSTPLRGGVFTSLLCLFLFWGSGYCQAIEENSKLKIEQFRFWEHGPLGFERLTIEFKQLSRSKAKPDIKSIQWEVPEAKIVQLSNLSVVGAFPEANINSKALEKSRYFASISFVENCLERKLSVNLLLKSSALILDAFWMKKPERLVLDVFPPTALRKKVGPKILNLCKSRKPACLKRAALKLLGGSKPKAKITKQKKKKTNKKEKKK